MMNVTTQKFIQGLADGYDLITEDTRHRHPPGVFDPKADDQVTLLDKQGVPISSKAVLFALITAIWTAILISILLAAMIGI